MKLQKTEVLSYVASERQKGRTVSEILSGIQVSKSSYYRWKKGSAKTKGKATSRVHTVTPDELQKVIKMKERHPELRHRQIQGLLQAEGCFISPSVVYRHLKSEGLVEPYERRQAPWKEPFYEIYKANVMWGADWSQMRINGRRWYLLTLIDFYSRFLVHFDVVPSVHSGHIKELYQTGLSVFNIPLDWHLKPELRLDQGSPNTSKITREFFEDIGADLSYASVRRPTENAITERLYKTAKQEEIYIIGDYPDEVTAKENLRNYFDWYNDVRPHQSLWNFTPRIVHELNNKTELLKMLKELKQKAWTQRREYWKNRN